MRRPARLGLKVVMFLIFSFFLPLPHSEAGVEEQVLEKVLANGLKVILLENNKAPVITFQVWYRVGSRDEEWGKTGLSHMLEHMMFKGTHKVNGEEFARITQVNGGNDNAFTSRDFTAYFENLSADRVHVSLDLESDRMQNLVLREEDFRTERMVVLLGGRTAEEIVFGEISTEAQNDLEKASEIARRMLTEYGMSERQGPITFEKELRPLFLETGYSPPREYGQETANEIDEEFKGLVKESYEKVKKTLRSKQPVLHRIARTLLEKEIIEGDELRRLLNVIPRE